MKTSNEITETEYNPNIGSYKEERADPDSVIYGQVNPNPFQSESETVNFQFFLSQGKPNFFFKKAISSRKQKQRKNLRW